MDIINHKNIIHMEKLLISSHNFLLDFGRKSFNEDFNVEKVKEFLTSSISESLVEYAETTQIGLQASVDNAPVDVKIIKACQNQKGWFAVFKLSRPMYKKYKVKMGSTFVYIQGEGMFHEIADYKGKELEGELIYSCKE
jgi:hypothetical protein